MARTIVDLSREISHMMPVANPHINQVPAFWDRMTHASTKGRWESDISFHIRDFLIGEHVGTHVDALCHYDPRPDAPCLDKLPLDMFLTDARVHRRLAREARQHSSPCAISRTGLEKAEADHQEGRHLPLLAGLLRAQGRAQLAARVRRPRLGRGPLARGPRRRQRRLRVREHRQLGGDARSTPSPRSPPIARCRDRGVINTENLANLEKVVGKRFLYIGLPLRLVGGTGCPIRAVAVLDT